MSLKAWLGGSQEGAPGKFIKWLPLIVGFLRSDVGELLLIQLAQLGHECHGSERSELAAQRARKTVGLRIYTTPLAQSGLEPHSFDLVILWHVLEHLEEPEQYLSLINHMLRPGGLLLLEVPNYSSLQSQFSGKHWFHLDLDRHLYHFSKRSQ
jgi:2-polyprenyl-3-methyl-5-hydroxy-6-metoxy-1,4-benzoquinol methylase